MDKLQNETGSEVKPDRDGPNKTPIKNPRVEPEVEDPSRTTGGFYRLLATLFAFCALGGSIAGSTVEFVMTCLGLMVGFTICAELCRISYRLGDRDQDEEDSFWEPREDRLSGMSDSEVLDAFERETLLRRNQRIASTDEFGRLTEQDRHRLASAWDRRSAQRERERSPQPPKAD